MVEKNKNFYAHKISFHFLLECDRIPVPLAIDQYENFSGHPNVSEFLELQKYWNSQIATDCSVLADSVFFVLCAYFDGSMVMFDEFFSIEKLEYSRYNTKTKYELVWYSTYSSDLLFLY